eukprot:COSAG02_NODE_27691_length_604_cov_1.437624_1_plen_52_part_10
MRVPRVNLLSPQVVVRAIHVFRKSFVPLQRPMAPVVIIDVFIGLLRAINQMQ